ncbi:MAG: acetoacetate--CoA ligase, partial [Candidatus Saccharibacteria bacterium]
MRKLLWKPSDEYIRSTRMYEFMGYVNEKYDLALKVYSSLYAWSVENIPEFWDTLWQFLDIKVSQPYTTVVKDLDKLPGAVWFPGARLNYAENMLRFSELDGPALIFRGENEIRSELSHRELYDAVVRLAASLRADGIKPGDTIAAYMPNLPETVIGMLAAAAVGAVWCSCATDIGYSAAIDRLGQVKPRILFTTDGYYYKGKTFDVLENARQVAAGIDSVEKVIIAHYAGDISQAHIIPGSVHWEDYLADRPVDFAFEQLPSEHPLLVMFSSGTTGKPKCMVQSAAGLLINQLKELLLHTDLKTSDRLLYITTCSWMMWNWQLAAIGTGAAVVLYDGNPSWPDTAAIWKVLEQEKVTVFGLSASYIHALMAEGFSPGQAADLSELREISQTGSALSDVGFDYVYREIKADLFFNSIAGGTDINGCFCTASPISPVYSGELQGAGLGMKVNCYDENGQPLRDEQGELVCEAPSPSMPIGFWNDPTGSRYLDAYFRVYPSTWHHGDYIVIHS